MPSATLTEEQRSAVAARDVSVALSAGAGCGKTYVLTERYLSHLDPKIDGEERARLGQLVAITFTDAAAREMRSRIRRASYDRLIGAANGQEQAYWQRLLREIDGARVSTIHAFCASLLRAHAAGADLDPSFAVLDQGQADLLGYEAIDDTLREQLDKLDPDTLDLACAFGLSRLKQQVAALLARHHDVAFAEWLDKSAAELVAAWQRFHEEKAFPLAVRLIADEAPIAEVVALLNEIDTRGKKAAFIEAHAALLELLPRVQQGTVTVADLQAIRGYARVQGLCNAKDWSDGDAYSRYKDACTELRGVIDSQSPRDFDPEAAEEPARLGIQLLQLVAKSAKLYQRRKKARGALDFDDLLSAAYRLIADPKNAALRRQISEDLRLLLVDEFQDTDQLQVDLVKALCGPGFDAGRLFFVGDFKQSIYRFRGAQPSVFLDLRAQIREAGRLPLTVNFRSQPAILNFVNALFCDTFTTKNNEYEALRAERAQITELPAIEFLWTIDAEKNNMRMPGAVLKARRKEASAIARRLRALLDEDCPERPIVDKKTGTPRKLEPGDVAILFRALSDVQVYEEALREHGLDYYLVGGHAFYAQQEIFDVLNLARAVASTADEVSLSGVLRSPFFALQDETLFWLVESAGSLNRGLAHFAESSEQNVPVPLSAEERAKVVAAAATIRHLRSIKDRVPIATLLGEALERTGYDAVLLTEFLGRRKLANLHKLIEQARTADRGGIDLDGFITQLSQFIARDPKEALAATLPEAANVIRLMTIHHAKGLEFPLVIVPDLDRRPSFPMPPAALHRELGPLVPMPTDEEPKKAVTGMSLFTAAERADELEERKRLLYVATTRAADYLILSSSLQDYDKPVSDWMKLLAERFDLESGRLVASLPAEYEPPAVRMSPPLGEDKPAGKTRGADLEKMLAAAHQLAADGQGEIPAAVAPISVDHAARRMYSFSRLTGRLVQYRLLALRGGDHLAERDDYVDPRGFGTLVHEVLARIDFRQPADVAAWCEHLAPEHVSFNSGAAAKTAGKMIARFIASPAGRRLAEATAMHREVEFLLAWPPGETNGDGIKLRGYIDCLYQDADGNWRILDYKTDEVSPADVARIAQRYEMQLYVYALAAERALGQPPVELALQLLRPGVEHVFAWNDAARRRAVAMVNKSIQSLTQRREGAEALVQ